MSAPGLRLGSDLRAVAILCLQGNLVRARRPALRRSGADEYDGYHAVCEAADSIASDDAARFDNPNPYATFATRLVDLFYWAPVYHP